MNSQMEPNLLYCSKSVASIFTWGRETPTHAFVCIIFEFFMLYVLTFHASHACCSMFLLTCLTHVFGQWCNTVKAFLPFDALFMHFSLSHPRC